MTDPDRVLVGTSHRAIFHLSGPDGGPQCGNGATAEFARVTRTALPDDYRVCKQCDPDTHANCGAPCDRLAALDPDEVGPGQDRDLLTDGGHHRPETEGER